MTRPEVRSPYSAEGMPRTTSTLSMSSALICLRSVPVNAVALKGPCVIAPLLLMGMPSTMILEPKALVLLFTSVRNCRLEWLVRSVFLMICPGNSCMTSASDEACRWSMAWRPIWLLVPIAFCLAVTTTSLSERSLMRKGICRSRSLLTFT